MFDAYYAHMNPIYAHVNMAGRQISMRFDQDSPVHRNILAELHESGAYERATQFFLMRVLKAGDTFVDVGAHIGYFSLLAAAIVGDDGQVIAVEPMDENFEQLTHHVTENDLSNIAAVNAVIADSDGETKIFFNADNDGGHALWDPALHPVNEQTRQNPRADTVRSCRLDSLLHKFDVERVRLMKIDTEGAEATILDAARSVFVRGLVDFAILEVNMTGLQNMGSSIDDLFRLIRELGYVICLPRDDGSAPVILASDNRPDDKFVYNVLIARPEALAGL